MLEEEPLHDVFFALQLMVNLCPEGTPLRAGSLGSKIIALT